MRRIPLRRVASLSLVSGGLTVGLVAAGLTTSGASAASFDLSRASAHAQPAGPIRFSHAVVVDEQRPGFEPDIKVGGNGVIYSSVPFGFSTTQSFVWASHDHGNSYQFVPGVIGPGKPSTCAGGGDSDLFVDHKNALYFSDLQGLTNISNSMSTNGGATWTTNCAGAPNTPDDRMWFAGTGASADGNLTLYQDYDVVDSALPNGGNQLVETVSHDGTHFTPVVNTAGLTSGCTGASVDCVTDNEGISGNQVVDPATGNVYIAHTSVNGNSAGSEVGVMVAEGKITAGTTTSASWSESPNLDGPLCPDPSCVDAKGNPEELAGENFASIARDSAGYLYVTFTAGPLDHTSSSDPNFGALTAPEQIYVVHSLEPAGADPSKLTWSAPTRLTGNGISAGTNTFPWIVAGSGGRVDVAWYHSSEVSQKGTCASGSGTCTLFGASNLTHAEWTVQLGQSLNASAASPSYTTANVSETSVKYGQICTNGIGCATGGDRSLGDFLQVTIDQQGAALVSYVFDTSGNTSGGENAGPEVISRQISGPSLLAPVGGVTQDGGPGLAMGSVTDPVGDAYYSANGSRTPASANLDLTGASLANGPKGTLVATIDVHSLASLTVSPTVGGPDASWMLRWTVVTPGKTGNGDIYYAGMDNNAGAGGSGTPTFFAGSTASIPPANPAEHTKYITYPQTHLLGASQASYDTKTGVITMHIPLSDVGSPPPGTVLYSATGFSATSTSPQSATNLFNLIDATTPFELVAGPPPAVTSVTPSQGPTAGRTRVTIRGNDFFGVKSVLFGTARATQVTVASPDELTAVSPPGTAGAVDVTVTTPYGTSPTSLDDLFTYYGTGVLSKEGYWLAASNGEIFTFGHAHSYGSARGVDPKKPVVGIAAEPSGLGYWLATSDGRVFGFGKAMSFGSKAGMPLSSPVVGIAATPDGGGYWLVTSRGNVFGFGDARFFGSAGAIHLKRPVVGMAATPDGRGYWLVASDGGVFTYGDARFFGSAGAIQLKRPVVGMAASPDGRGYWLVASDGGVFRYGDARFFGSTGAIQLKRPVVGMAASPDGRGYWLVASDGGVFTFGDGKFFGSMGARTLTEPIVGMAPAFSS